jgi:hypothetical protein
MCRILRPYPPGEQQAGLNLVLNQPDHPAIRSINSRRLNSNVAETLLQLLQLSPPLHAKQACKAKGAGTKQNETTRFRGGVGVQREWANGFALT